MTSWESLADVLRNIYTDNNLEHAIAADFNNLAHAFDFTETFWNDNLNQISNVRFVLFAEAPQFWPNESYFYNPLTAPTSFFYYRDIAAILDDGCRLPTRAELLRRRISEKEFMIETLQRQGVVILDIFPYALKPGLTSIDYTNARLYRRILSDSIPLFLRPKLARIKDIAVESLKFAYRYNRLRDRVNYFIQTELLELRMIADGQEIPSIGGRNMPMDQERFARLPREAISG